MCSAKLERCSLAALLFRFMAAAILLSLFRLFAQDSSSDNLTLRSDRPTISLTARDSAGETITTAGTVKLFHDGVIADNAGLSHGRAFSAHFPLATTPWLSKPRVTNR